MYYSGLTPAIALALNKNSLIEISFRLLKMRFSKKLQ